MSQTAVQDLPKDVLSDKISDLIASQQRYFKSGETKNLRFRVKQLQALKKAIKLNEEKLFTALRADLGKPPLESYATEVGFLLEEINYTLKHLSTWAKPTPVTTPLTLAISSAKVYKEPYGQTLIIAPWNYPVQLALSPLIGALAAGNTAIIKPSEFAPATSKALAELIAGTFKPEYVAVLEGGVETNQALLEKKFDYIFFTGSPKVGQIVMQAATRHLTPVTLELGGKSPCIVDEKYHLKNTARRIAWGKWVNCGQTCIAPDYLLVPEPERDRLVNELKSTLEDFYGKNPAESEDYGKIINERHFDRLTHMLDQGEVVHGGQHNREQRYIAPTLLLNPDLEADLMQEEIFGPLLPIVTYKTLDEAIDFVNSKSRPLALYLFTNSAKTEDHVLEHTQSGGGCVNDTLVHLASPELPFGGIGTSGMGNYHGKRSFDTFTHERSILKKSNLIDPNIRYAPYKKKLKILKWLMG